MIKITVKDLKYKQWLAHRNRKNLERRTRLRVAKKGLATQYISLHTTPEETLYNSKEGRYEFIAPRNFSIIHNPVETINYLSNILNFIKKRRNQKKTIYVDISGVTHLSIDALMYLISIISNTKKRLKESFSISGNYPEDGDTKNLLISSGFHAYVRSSQSSIARSGEYIKIRSGNFLDIKMAREVCDFTMKICNTARKSTRFLYETLIELMTNTRNHAYNDNDGSSLLLNYWYVFVESDGSVVRYTFLDVGEGIPKTVNKKLHEKVLMLKLKSDSEYIKSALTGKLLRTSTKQRNRGKGLPSIYGFTEGKIQNFKIISGKGTFGFDLRPTKLENPLQGTLYYWEISVDSVER